MAAVLVPDLWLSCRGQQPCTPMLQQPVVQPARLDDGEIAHRRCSPGIEIVQEGPDLVPQFADLPTEEGLYQVVPHRYGQPLQMLGNAQ